MNSTKTATVKYFSLLTGLLLSISFVGAQIARAANTVRVDGQAAQRLYDNLWPNSQNDSATEKSGHLEVRKIVSERNPPYFYRGTLRTGANSSSARIGDAQAEVLFESLEGLGIHGTWVYQGTTYAWIQVFVSCQLPYEQVVCTFTR